MYDEINVPANIITCFMHFQQETRYNMKKSILTVLIYYKVNNKIIKYEKLSYQR